MKSCFFTLWLVTSLASALPAQVVNQITIIPSNPAPGDTISVISDFTYNGNCAFGMVYFYSTLVDSTIMMIPTYCGYFDTTICNSIDTFQIGPYPAGNYTINIEYHQGSVCPISGFDATIAYFDTSVVVSGTSGIADLSDNFQVKIYPNPAREFIILKYSLPDNKQAWLNLFDVYGKRILRRNLPEFSTFQRIDVKHLAPGFYFCVFASGKNRLVGTISVID